MVNTGNTLHLAFKLHAGRIGLAAVFRYFVVRSFANIWRLNGLFYCVLLPVAVHSCCRQGALHPDILLLCPAKFLRQLAHMRLLVAGSRFASKALSQSSTSAVQPRFTVHISSGASGSA